jgi:hypothetical protein
MSRRSKRRLGTRNTQLIPLDASGFDDAASFWSSDAYVDPVRGNSAVAAGTSRATVAMVPTSREGAVTGLAHVLDFPEDSGSTPQAELLGCLAAHVLARVNGEEAPVILTDFQAAESFLDSVLGLRTMKRPKKYTPMAQLTSLIEIMGEEVEYVHLHWIPRKSTDAMQLVDRLCSRRASKPEQGVHWEVLGFEDLMSLAAKMNTETP